MTSQTLPLYEEILLLAMDDPILDECLTLVADAKKPKKARDWVKIFKRTIYPEVDGGPEKDLRARMEKAIFTATDELEARTVIITTST